MTDLRQRGTNRRLPFIARLVFGVGQVAAALLLLGALGLVLAGVAPTFFGEESFTVYTGSMEPTIHVGALAVVKPTKTADLKAGDIVTYRLPTQPDVIVTHRLIGIVEQGEGADKQLQYQTKGDANNVADLVLVNPNAVLGKVIYSVPVAGYVVDFSKRDVGKLLFLALPAALLVLDYLRGRRQSAKTRRAAPPFGGTQIIHHDRLAALLQRGQEALDGGYLELAEKAADGVLEIDPRNEDAWLLKATSARTPNEQKLRLQAALMVNPKAARVGAMLETLQSAVVNAAAPTADASPRNGASHDEPSRASA